MTTKSPGSSFKLRFSSTGPGDSDRRVSDAEGMACCNGASHISQCWRDLWFEKVHLGHVMLSSLVVGLPLIESGVTATGEGEADAVLLLLIPACMAAFRMVANGGFIPQVRHGGSGKASVAVDVLKFDGTGLENEHIGQIHVPRLTGGVTACTTGLRRGLAVREDGEDDGAASL